MNCLVPAKLGDLYRAYLLRANYAASLSRTVGTVFVERIADIIIIALAGPDGRLLVVPRPVAAGDRPHLHLRLHRRHRPDHHARRRCAIGGQAARSVHARPLRRATGAVPRGQHRRAHAPGSLPVILTSPSSSGCSRVLGSTSSSARSALPDVGPRHQRIGLRRARGGSPDRHPAHAGRLRLRRGRDHRRALALRRQPEEPAAAVALVDRAISIVTVIILGGILYAFSGKIRRAHGMRAAPVAGLIAPAPWTADARPPVCPAVPSSY